MDSVRILKTDISVTSIHEVSSFLMTNKNVSVAICNVNTLVRCYRNEELNKILNSFSIKCPDGFPVAKASHLLYKNNQKRVDGYKVFLTTIKKSLEENKSHYFFGSTEEVTKKMISELKIMFPDINIKGFFCPPILSHDELNENKYISDLIEKKPDILWVSLGFPKQEQFINLINNIDELNTNMIGVGAVFEWAAKTKYKAPEWLAELGFEWIVRLIQEPKRLLRRYLVDNFLFIIYFVKQYFKN